MSRAAILAAVYTYQEAREKHVEAAAKESEASHELLTAQNEVIETLRSAELEQVVVGDELLTVCFSTDAAPYLDWSIVEVVS